MGTVVHPEEGSEDATGKDCEGCLNHLATIQRLTDVIHEQASTIKDQQNSIASLIARVQAGGGPGNTTGKKSTAASAVSHASQDVEGKPKLPAENGNGGASARGRGRPRRSSISQTTTPVRQTKQEEEGSAAGGSQRGKRPISVRGPTAKRAPEAGKRGEAVPLGSSPEPNSKQSRSGDDDDTVEVTRIWITGTPNPKTRCPLPQCINRKFAAVDMYHFRRHFMQVHRTTHPNPEFVLQCPIESCSAEYENSLKDIKDHMRKEHPELFGKSPKNGKDEYDDDVGEADDVDEQMSDAPVGDE